MTMGTLYRTDGTSMPLRVGCSMDEIHKLIDTTSLDMVSLHHLGQPLQVMLLDDYGWETEVRKIGPSHFARVPVRALKPFNAKATELYLANCKPGTTHTIVGDVVVIGDGDFTP